MNLTSTFLEILSFPWQSSEPYHIQVGNAEASLEIIWTWAVVKINATKINCWTAKFETIIDDIIFGLAKPDFLEDGDWRLSPLSRKAQSPEVVSIANIGAPRRKRGMFDTVQYRNNPQFLEWLRSWDGINVEWEDKPVITLNKCVYAWQGFLTPRPCLRICSTKLPVRDILRQQKPSANEQPRRTCDKQT